LEEATIDKKGRIVISRHLRERLGLRGGIKVRLILEGDKIMIARPLTPDEFIHEMEGCIKEGSLVPKMDPLELKKIWERQ